MKKKSWTLDPDAVPIAQGALTLVVIRRFGSSLAGFRIEVDLGVETALREICERTVDRIRETDNEYFSPDVRISRDEHLTVPEVGLILPSSAPGDIASSPDATPPETETDLELRAIFGLASSLLNLSARQLPDGFLLYGVAIGDDPSDRYAFVRKANPRSAVRPGRLITAFGDRLQRIETPLLVLDDHFDLIIATGGLVALNQAVFEQLFRDTNIMLRRIPAYVKALRSVLPLQGDGAQQLTDRCLARPRLAKKLRALYENGLLEPGQFTIADVRAEAKRQGVDPARVIRYGRLIFDPDAPGLLLELLNEDLYTGGLSKRRYRATAKTRRN